MVVQWLTVSGVLWDIAAALYLAKGLTSTDDEIRRSAVQYWDISPPGLRSLCSDRLNIRWGLCHFIVGALLQLASAFGASLDGWLFALSVLPLVGAAFWHFRYSKQDVAASALRIGGWKIRDEQTWRRHFQDLSEDEWRSAVKRSGVELTPPVSPTPTA